MFRDLRIFLAAIVVAAVSFSYDFNIPLSHIPLSPLKAFAQSGAACTWTYSFLGGIAQAFFCGDVAIQGKLTVNGGHPIVQFDSNGIAQGNIAVGGSTGNLTDSGVQPIKTGVANRDPNNIDSSVFQFSVGSVWINTATGALWVASDVTPNLAVWTKATPTTYYTYDDRSWVVANIVASGNVFSVPGGNLTVTCTNSNCYNIVLSPTILNHLTLHTAASPAAGSYTITVWTGTLGGALTATLQSCTFSSPAFGCSDDIHPLSLIAGQIWTTNIVSTSATATGTSAAAIQLKILGQP